MAEGAASGPPHGDDPTPKPGGIDMRPAENWLLRPELIPICQQAIAKLSLQDLSFPYNPRGYPDLLQSLATFFNEHFMSAVFIEEGHIVTGPGADRCLQALLSVVCKPGERVLVPCPYWGGFDFLCANAQIQLIPAVISDDLHQSLSTNPVPALAKALANSKCKVRAILMTNPHNPLGRSIDLSILKGCLRFCEANNLHYISDEVYALTRFPAADLPDSPKFTSVLSFDLQALDVARSRVHVVWSTSKDLGQSGMRIGCAVSQDNPTVIRHLAGLLVNSISTLSSKVTCELLRSCRFLELLELNSDRLHQAYSAITQLFKDKGVEYYPCDSGPYIHANVVPGAQSQNDVDRVVDMFEEAGVYIFSLQAFHPPSSAKGWMRFNFAINPKELEIALTGLHEVWANISQLDKYL